MPEHIGMTLYEIISLAAAVAVVAFILLVCP